MVRDSSTSRPPPPATADYLSDMTGTCGRHQVLTPWPTALTGLYNTFPTDTLQYKRYIVTYIKFMETHAIVQKIGRQGQTHSSEGCWGADN